MNPPTEQLIRDYLNRVSVAARGRLSADDRRAFVARTREFIDQNTRALGRIQTADVLKLLSELGDPLSLVNAERQRLAAGATEPGAGTPADTSLAARARRLRAAPANVASLLRASATVVAPGDAPAVAEPADDNPMTGDFEEIVSARRPISSRWKPGEIVIPRQPGQRRPGLSRRRPRPSVPPADGRAQPSAPAEPAPGPQAEPPPLVGDIPPPRPEWPGDPARRPAAPDAEETPSVTRPARMPFAASGSAADAPPDAGAPGREPGVSGPTTATGAGATEAASAGSGSVSPAGTAAAGGADSEEPRPVNRNTLIDPPAGGADAGLGVPPRGARVTWAAGVRSKAMRMGAVRAAGARLSAARPGGSRRGQAGPGAGAESGPVAGSERGPAAEREREFLATAGAAGGRAVRVAVSWARRHPLESTAVVLLGLGGLIYPPVWLMGALVAAFSRIWSIRDKWIGLVLPVFLVIVGIVVEVSTDGTHQHWTTYVRDAWLFAGHLSRILALLGAIYLAWRAERGPRSPGMPPWQRSRRFG